MQMEGREVGEVLVVKPLDKRIDASGSPDFKGKMVDWVNSGKNRIVLDLSGVDFIDSGGLGTIVSILKTLGSNGDLYISGLQETVGSLFRLTRMDRVFRLYSSVEDAVAAMSDLPPAAKARA